MTNLHEVLIQEAKTVVKTCRKWKKDFDKGIPHTRSWSDYSAGFQNTVHAIHSAELITDAQVNEIWDLLDKEVMQND